MCVLQQPFVARLDAKVFNTTYALNSRARILLASYEESDFRQLQDISCLHFC